MLAVILVPDFPLALLVPRPFLSSVSLHGITSTREIQIRDWRWRRGVVGIGVRKRVGQSVPITTQHTHYSPRTVLRSGSLPKATGAKDRSG